MARKQEYDNIDLDQHMRGKNILGFIFFYNTTWQIKGTQLQTMDICHPDLHSREIHFHRVYLSQGNTLLIRTNENFQKTISWCRLECLTCHYFSQMLYQLSVTLFQRLMVSHTCHRDPTQPQVSSVNNNIAQMIDLTGNDITTDDTINCSSFRYCPTCKETCDRQ